MCCLVWFKLGIDSLFLGNCCLGVAGCSVFWNFSLCSGQQVLIVLIWGNLEFWDVLGNLGSLFPFCLGHLGLFGNR
jgi:hypothetical protein